MSKRSEYRIADDIPVEYLAAIGEVAVTYGWIDSAIEGAIHSLSGVDNETGIAITSHMSLPLRLNVLQSLINLRLKENDNFSSDNRTEINKELERYLRRIKKAAKDRAEIVHALWFSHPTDGIIANINSARSEIKVSFDQKTVDQIHAVTDRLNEILYDFAGFLAEIFGTGILVGDDDFHPTGKNG